MKFIMIDAFKGASGKLCGHSDMGATYIGRTGATYSHKLCNKRNLEELPYSEKELAQQASFKTRAAVVSNAVKALSADQRKALILVRNERGLFCVRQLIEEIYDKKTNSVPADKLAELVASGKMGGTSGTGGTTGTPGTSGGTSSGGGGTMGDF